MKKEVLMIEADSVENFKVTRSNILIESNFKVTLQELRMVYWILSNIQPTDKELKTYRIQISEYNKFLKKFGISQSKDVYKILERTAEKLMSRVVNFYLDDVKYSVPFINRIAHHSKAGFIDIRLDELLKDYLINLSVNFTSIGLLVAFKLNSTYSIRLLEIIMQYKAIGKRTVSVEQLRFMFGVDEKSYRIWSNFESRILKHACDNVNKHTNLGIKYKKIKKGKSIVSVEFNFNTSSKMKVLNTSTVLADIDTVLEETPEVRELMIHGIKTKKARDLFKNNPNKVYEALESIKSQIDTIRNPAAWIITFIEQDWEGGDKPITHVKNKIIEEQEEDLRIDNFKNWKEYVHSEIKKYTNKLTPHEKTTFKTNFINTLSDSLKKQAEKSLKNPVLLKSWVLFFNNIDVFLPNEEEFFQNGSQDRLF